MEALIGFQFNHVGGGTKTRRPITLHMKYNGACVQPMCWLVNDDMGEVEMTLEELQVGGLLITQLVMPLFSIPPETVQTPCFRASGTTRQVPTANLHSAVYIPSIDLLLQLHPVVCCAQLSCWSVQGWSCPALEHE